MFKLFLYNEDCQLSITTGSSPLHVDKINHHCTINKVIIGKQDMIYITKQTNTDMLTHTLAGVDPGGGGAPTKIGKKFDFFGVKS